VRNHEQRSVPNFVGQYPENHVPLATNFQSEKVYECEDEINSALPRWKMVVVDHREVIDSGRGKRPTPFCIA
jgi:hypothetical protein